MAAFGLLDGTPAHAGATYIPPSITTVALPDGDPGLRVTVSAPSPLGMFPQSSP